MKDAFGQKVSESDAAITHLYGYTGREYNEVTKLQYNRARYYDPKLGRWINDDPKGFDAGDANLYRYVGNGPTNGTDPSGLDDLTDVKNVEPSEELLEALSLANRVIKIEFRIKQLEKEHSDLGNEIFYLNSATPTLSTMPRFAGKAKVQARYNEISSQLEALNESSEQLQSSLASDYEELEVGSMIRYYRDDYSGAVFKGGKGGDSAMRLAIFLFQQDAQLGKPYATGGGADRTVGPEDIVSGGAASLLRMIAANVAKKIALRTATRVLAEDAVSAGTDLPIPVLTGIVSSRKSVLNSVDKGSAESGCFVAGTLVHLTAIPEVYNNTPVHIRVGVGDTLHSPVLPIGSTCQNAEHLIAIENVPIGSRVSAKNPEESVTAINWEQEDTRVISLVVQRNNGSVVDVELLRPLREVAHLRIGQHYPIFSRDLNIDGFAKILSIDDGVEIADGEGSVVTGRFSTRRVDRIIRVELDDGTIIEGTPVHPAWVVNRQGFVALEELAIGDLLDSVYGTRVVVGSSVKNDPVPVYNIEVQNDHVYRVAFAGILVHNPDGDCLKLYQIGNAPVKGDFHARTNVDGLPVRVEGVITGPHPKRPKGSRPEPVGGRDPGHHRGHLVPENMVENPSLVNVQDNIISEASRSNLSGKKIFENYAGEIAKNNPNSVVRTVHFPKRRPGETVPFAVTHYVTVDGKVVHGVSILNR